MTRTALAVALVIAVAPAIAGAQQTTQQDSTRRGRITESRGGEVSSTRGRVMRTRANNYGLDRDQIRQLQQAINDRTECNAGTADGIIGPRTRRALTCARRELDVRAGDMDALFAALNLDFGQAGEQPGLGTINRSGRASEQGRDSTMQKNRPGNRAGQRDSTMRDTTMRGNPPGRDSTARDTTAGQQPPR